MRITSLLFPIVCLLCFCCDTSGENKAPTKKFSIKAMEITPSKYYINKERDTTGISQTLSYSYTIDTSFRLPLKTAPIERKAVLPVKDNIILAKPAKIIPFLPSMFDTISRANTLKLNEQTLTSRLIKVERTRLQNIDSPILQAQSSYSINTLHENQILPSISGLTKDNKDILWLFSGSRLFSYNGISTKSYRFASDIKIKQVFVDSQSNIWLSSPNKLIRYDGLHFSLLNELSTTYPLFEDKKGRVWFISEELGFIQDSSIVSFPSDLLHSKIESIFEDKEGGIWILDSGLNVIKYDGKHLLKLKSAFPGIQSFSSPQKDKDGNIWMIGSWNNKGALIKFDNKNFYVYTIDLIDLDPDFSFAYINICSNGNLLLFNLLDNGIIQFDGTHFEYIGTQQGLPTNISFLTEDDAQNIWMKGNDDKIYIYHPNNIKHYNFNPPNHSPPLLDKDGSLWWRFYREWWKLEKDSIHHISFPPSTDFPLVEKMNWNNNHTYFQIQQWATPYLQDEDGGIWSCRWDHSIRYKNDSFAVLPTAGVVHNIIEDAERQIWLTPVNTKGEIKIQRLNAQGLSTLSFVPSVKKHEPALWEGQLGGILVDQKQHFWGLGMYRDYILQFDGKQLNYYSFPLENLVTKAYTNIASITNLNPIEDQSGQLWFIVGKYNLIKYDGNIFWNYDFSPYLKEPLEWFTKDEKDRFWITTKRNGIILFDQGEFIFFDESNGLLHNETSLVARDFKNRMWVSTFRGLSVIGEQESEKGKNEYQIHSYQEADGLNIDLLYDKGLQFDSTKNEAFMRSNEGFVQFNLDQLDAEPYTPKNLTLAQVDIDDQFIDYTQIRDTIYQNTLKFGEKISQSFSRIAPFYSYPSDLSLPHYINNLAFHFSATNWEAPRKVRYSFKMKGVDQDWTAPQSAPNIKYRNLPHGKHTLLARAKNETGMWSQPFEYKFRIHPPWWLSTGAYIFYTLLFCAALYISFFLFKRRLDLKNAYEQEQIEAQRLKELDTFKSRLYTNLTHEFRTPLTIILGMVDQIRTAPKKYLDEGTLLIERNGKNLLHLINQLLDLSKLEDNSFQLQLRQSDIVSYLRYLTQAFQTYANGHNLSLDFYSNLEKLEMDFDAEQMKQIMTNLISNAVKYTPSGGAIKVKVAKLEEQLSLQIQDTGVGISAFDLPHIFDRFYQVDDSSTRKGGGTGIGLAHTQELVRLMKGEIQVESELGSGSIFIISLPISNIAPKENTTQLTKAFDLDLTIKQKSKDTKSVNKNQESLHQLLIIEDNSDVVTYLKACLEDQYQIDVAFNGRIGIEKAIESIPDLIISDVMMPEKDGYEVCDTLKQDERTSHIPIILLTAKADLPSKIVGLRRGADAYLSKPFDKEELLVRLEMMVAKQQKLATYFSKNGESRVEVETLEEAVKIEHEFIQKIRKIVEQHYANDQFGLPQLCQKAGMSRSQLYRKMKALIDTSPSDFIRTYRLQQAKHLLETTDLNVSEAAWDTGFTNLTHFAKVFQEEFGMLPSKLKT